MTLATTQTTTLWRRTLDRIEVVGILAALTVFPPLTFLALLMLQHHTV